MSSPTLPQMQTASYEDDMLDYDYFTPEEIM